MVRDGGDKIGRVRVEDKKGEGKKGRIEIVREGGGEMVRVIVGDEKGMDRNSEDKKGGDKKVED